MLRNKITINAGIPKREVIIPTGSSAGGITERANKSHIDKNAAANIKEKIKRRECLGPVIILTAFGIIKPTKPMIPENARNLNGTFASCTSLNGDIIIDALSPYNIIACLYEVNVDKINLKGNFGSNVTTSDLIEMKRNSN